MILAARDLSCEVAKHFRGTAEERIRWAREMGQRALAIFVAAQSKELTHQEAARVLNRNKNRGRRPSRVMASRYA